MVCFEVERMDFVSSNKHCKFASLIQFKFNFKYWLIMTNEQERHDQANDLVEITEQADAQNPVGMTTDKSADSEEVADDARVSDDNPTFPTEGDRKSVV